MRWMKKNMSVIVAVSLLLLTASQSAFGQEEAAAAAEATDGAAVAWMLVSSALVLFMTAPGLAMFYGGLVRRKNVLGVIMQCLFLMGMMSVIWALWGYSLAFGDGGKLNDFIGGTDFLLLQGVTMTDGKLPIGAWSAGLPDIVFMIFQGMFFIITPALICGAFAERMKFSAMVIFSILWGTIVYCPLCHMVWGGGLLAFGADGLRGGALDFAGGTVVHISSGVSALIAAMLIGRRMGFGSEDMRPHNLTYTSLGAAMLWVGWFGFNAGSALGPTDVAANAFVVTHLSAAAGAVAWALVEWLAHGKPSVLGTASGAVAGLVCITPACGFVQPMPAIVMGVIAGIVCYFACGTLKRILGYDDSLDAFGVHGVGGAIGAVLTGVFATRHVNANVLQGENGAVVDGLWYSAETGVPLMIGQLAAIGVTVVFAAVASFILLKLIDVTIGLRVSQEGELRGLDYAEHGEEGYIFT